MNTTDRILGEAQKVRPPTEEEHTDPEKAYRYARLGIKGRWPEAESVIATHPWSAYHYARNVLKRRWPEGEPAIAKDPWSAYHYATNVLKRRWPEGEAAIAKEPYYSTLYLELYPEAKLEWAMNGLIDWTDL